jgi:hypothetical protein
MGKKCSDNWVRSRDIISNEECKAKEASAKNPECDEVDDLIKGEFGDPYRLCSKKEVYDEGFCDFWCLNIPDLEVCKEFGFSKIKLNEMSEQSFLGRGLRGFEQNF